MGFREKLRSRARQQCVAPYVGGAGATTQKFNSGSNGNGFSSETNFYHIPVPGTQRFEKNISVPV
jgi:hypothetical protein